MFKILLYSKLIFSLIEFNIVTLCNLVIGKHFSLTIGYIGAFCMRYFALIGVIKPFSLFEFSQESKQYFKKVANGIFNAEIRKSVKVLV